MAVLANLSTFEGRSRFTTRAYKFDIPQCATEIRRIPLAAPRGRARRPRSAPGRRHFVGQLRRSVGPGFGGPQRDRPGIDTAPAPGHHRPARRRRLDRRSRPTVGHDPQRPAQDRAPRANPAACQPHRLRPPGNTTPTSRHIMSQAHPPVSLAGHATVDPGHRAVSCPATTASTWSTATSQPCCPIPITTSPRCAPPGWLCRLRGGSAVPALAGRRAGRPRSRTCHGAT
jgi:hypothetical protein